MTNSEYLKLEQDDKRLELFLYFSRKEMQSRTRIKVFLSGQVSQEKMNMVKLYSEQ